MSEEGSMRKMRASVVPTQSAPAAASRSAGVPGTENVLTTRRELGSIREIVPAPSFELITQTQSSEAVTVVGAAPTGIAATTLRETGSMAATEFGGATIPPSDPSARARTTAVAAAAISAAPAHTSRRPTRRRRRLTAAGEGPSPSAERASSTRSAQVSNRAACSLASPRAKSASSSGYAASDAGSSCM